MVDRRTVLLLLGATLAATGPAVRRAYAAQGSADYVVGLLYTLHAARPSDEPPLWTDPSIRSDLFSPDLIAAFDALAAWQARNPDEVPPLNGDPFWDAQDWDISGLEVDPAEAVDAAVASVTVRFRNFDEARVLRYKLVQTDAGWRIDDIGYEHPDGGYTLRDLLSGE
jgi:hypothetical protein